MKTISRRGILVGLVGGAVILGFDPLGRSWVTEAGASTSFYGLPPLDGSLTTDAAALAAIADDFGHILHRTPVAVLLPGSVDDIVAMVKFARLHGLEIAPRGRGHTTFGQSQAAAGVVIDMSSLSEIHSLTSHYAVVDAGVVWRDLLLATTAIGRTPPVLTDYIGLTVGGTLSVGGISGTAYRHGAQVDNVVELQVVTGEGKLLTCSPTHRARLFYSALAGLGLCAIIVRATLRLIAAKETARTHRCSYADVPTMLADMRLLVAEKRFSHLRASATPSPTGWAYFIEGTSFYTACEDAADDDCGLPDEPFAGLAFLPGSEETEEQSYFDFCDAVVRIIALLNQLGLGGLPHPWLDLFVPDSEVDDFASQTMADLDLATFQPGSIVVFYPLVKSKLQCPLLRVPDEDTFFLFDILQTTAPEPAVINAVLARNRALFEENRDRGGKEYTISAVPMAPHDWKKHFQPFWGALQSAKREHDPDDVLAAGVRVFR